MPIESAEAHRDDAERDLFRRLSRPEPPGPAGGILVLMVSLLAAVYALELRLVALLNVNWDEFYFLSFVHEARRHALSRFWTTFHVHLFGWLPGIAGTEVDEIVAARMALWVLLVASGLLLYAIARRFLGRSASVFAVLAYLSFTFVLRSGASFRPDPLCVALFLAAIWLLLPGGKRGRALVAGCALGVALLVTIKAALHVAFAVLFLVLLALYSPTSRRTVARDALSVGAGLAGTLLLLGLGHGLTLVASPSAVGEDFLGSTFSKMFGTGVLFPQAAVVLRSLRENPLTWVMLAAGLLLALRGWWRSIDAERGRYALFLSFLAPLATLAFYRNSFPYYFVFALPLATVTGAMALQVVLDRVAPRNRTLSVLLAVALALATFSVALAYAMRHRADETAVQRQVLEVVHRMYPEPVPYIDRCSMVSSFPKVGFFMSSWGLEKYRRAGRPLMRSLVDEKRPVFLLANAPGLRLDYPPSAFRGVPFALLGEDFAFLRSNYLHHWGPLFILGKEIRAEDGDTEVELVASGTYLVETDGELRVDEQAFSNGAEVALRAGTHRLTTAGGASSGRLVWGGKLFRPSEAPLPQPLFRDF